MKHVIAIVLLCLPAHLSATERCLTARHARTEIARVTSPPPRAEAGRSLKVSAPAAWQRLLLLEQQIL